MADKEPSQKAEPKMVLEADLIAYKEASKGREQKYKNEIENLKGQVQSVTSELDIAKASESSDEDVQKVRIHLLQQQKDLEKKVREHDKSVASVSERERKARARELVAEYREQGVSIEVDDLLEADDMELFSIRKRSDYLAEENKRLKEKPPEDTQKTRQVFETGNVSTRTKSPKDMTSEEFEQYLKGEREKALSR